MPEKTKTRITGMEKLVLIAIVILLIVVPSQCRRAADTIQKAVDEHQTEKAAEDKAAYSAWVKLTENPKGLTFEEWRALKDSGALDVQ